MKNGFITAAILTSVAILLSGSPAANGAPLSPQALGDVAAAPTPGATLPLALSLTDDNGHRLTLGQAIGGHPAVLVFADYTCRTLCGPIVSFAANGLSQTGLKPNADFRLIVIGLDPKDSSADAKAMKDSHIGVNSPIYPATLTLSGGPDDISALTKAAGYRYTYDADHDQFAHPAAAYVLAADGRIVRVLSGVGLDGADLRLALVDAGQGRVGTFADHIRLLCYGFDPASGVYTATIQRWLMVAAAMTVLAMGLMIGVLVLKTKQRNA